jgi:hypothetical protein
LGVLFIAATVSSIIGLVFYARILNNPDYLLSGPTGAGQIAGGALAELILVGTAVGTSLVLFPLLRRRDETLALGYVAFRLLEAVVIVTAIISFPSVLSLRQTIEDGASMDAAAVLELYGIIEQLSAVGLALALPIATFEMVLADYLIVGGFKTSSSVLRPVAVAT